MDKRWLIILAVLIFGIEIGILIGKMLPTNVLVFAGGLVLAVCACIPDLIAWARTTDWSRIV